VARRLSLAYLTVQGVSLAEQVSVAAEVGYDSVGLRLLGSRAPTPDAWRDAAQVREAERRLADTGMSVLDCEIFWLTPDTRVAEYRGLLEAICRLGGRLLLVLSRDPDRQRGCEQFEELCELAATYDVLCCHEFSKVTPVETLQQAVEIVTRSGQPNARVLVDALHLSRSGGTPADVAAVDPALFEYAQLCDAPATLPAPERMRQEPLDRLLPGQGGLPLVELVRALPPDLPVAVEAPVKALEQMPPTQRARLAMDSLRSVLEQA
jgi:sugar phosphate isomerase/epimerase